MRLIFTLVLLISSSLALPAQLIGGFRDPAWVAQLNGVTPAGGGGYDPTSVSTLKSWYKPGTFVTNAGVATWPDAKSGYDLTNGVGTTTPVGTNDGTRNLVLFDGGDHLANAAYTNTQPHEVWMALWKRTTSSETFFDSANIAGRNAMSILVNSYQIYAGTVLTNSTQFNTNDWVVVCGVFNGNSSSMLTNNVLTAFQGPVGAQNMSGFTLGARYDKTSQARFNVGEILTYSATNTGPERSNIWNYLRTNNTTWSPP